MYVFLLLLCDCDDMLLYRPAGGAVGATAPTSLALAVFHSGREYRGRWDGNVNTKKSSHVHSELCMIAASRNAFPSVCRRVHDL